jgi:hypothetical protein
MLAASSAAKALYVFLIVAVLLVFMFKFDLARLVIRVIEALCVWPVRAEPAKRTLTWASVPE